MLEVEEVVLILMELQDLHIQVVVVEVQEPLYQHQHHVIITLMLEDQQIQVVVVVVEDTQVVMKLLVDKVDQVLSLQKN